MFSMDNGKRRVMRLQGSVQNYAWGRRGEQSAVGRLYALQSKAPIEPDKPYAELWMGTHESGPSFVVLDGDDFDAEIRQANGDVDEAKGVVNGASHDHKGGNGDGSHYSNCVANGFDKEGTAYVNCDGVDGFPPKSMLLKDWLLQNPQVLGEKVLQRWGVDLPFLFKVLSVQKALSIQAHPDKRLAEHLHRLEPDIYKDANHKPEMAFAITSFEALCGFVSHKELQGIIETVPELQHVLGKSLSHALMNISESSENVVTATLKEAFTAIMTASKDMITHALTQLLSRLERVRQERMLTSKELLILRLAEQYPGDVGVLSAFFFNYIQLDPGQALYLSANEPHAYLSGECLECMATSDNVVRAGLTPKYIDTKTLCDMLTYKQGLPEILVGKHVNKYTKRYVPPFDEFEMDSCILPIGCATEFPANSGPSIVIVLQGNGDMSELHRGCRSNTPLKSGDIFFVPAGTHFEVTASSTSNMGMQFYRAGVNSRLLSESNGLI
eukprot:c22619_g1_i1 orf=282-1775(+)